jgi:hypothetical protein
MDTPIKVVMAVMVLMIVAVIMLGVFTDQVGPLGGFIDNKSQGAQCEVGLAEYKSACDCSLKGEAAIPETDEASRIKDKYSSDEYQCEWASGAGSYACHRSCPDWNPYGG